MPQEVLACVLHRPGGAFVVERQRAVRSDAPAAVLADRAARGQHVLYVGRVKLDGHVLPYVCLAIQSGKGGRHEEVDVLQVATVEGLCGLFLVADHALAPRHCGRRRAAAIDGVEGAAAAEGVGIDGVEMLAQVDVRQREGVREDVLGQVVAGEESGLQLVAAAKALLGFVKLGLGKVDGCEFGAPEERALAQYARLAERSESQVVALVERIATNVPCVGQVDDVEVGAFEGEVADGVDVLEVDLSQLAAVGKRAVDGLDGRAEADALQVGEVVEATFEAGHVAGELGTLVGCDNHHAVLVENPGAVAEASCANPLAASVGKLNVELAPVGIHDVVRHVFIRHLQCHIRLSVVACCLCRAARTWSMICI